MTGEEILALPMQENDALASTIKEYLINLLVEVWREGEGFFGKRPFGNSDWESELYVTLIKHGAIKGKLDEEGYLDRCDFKAGNKAIFEAIQAL